MPMPKLWVWNPGDHWWFLTGNRDPLVNFMTQELKLQPCQVIPAEEATQSP